MKRYLPLLFLLFLPIALGATAIQQLTISQAGRDLVAAEDAAAQREVLGLGHTVAVYSTGTAALSGTPAALDFSGTDPVVVLDQPGKWRINAHLIVGAFSADASCQFKLRRTNNSAGDIANSTLTVDVDGSYHSLEFVIPEVVVTTSNDDDAISIYGSNSEAEGSVLKAWIVAERIR